ncbi:hypothetical protein ABAC402_11585 [Asticcacaulis sp. AC402]|nr:hypothetical protein ABAC402_11585 [Asticcacaulis sp. AC402]
MSFTTGGLYLNESVAVARLYSPGTAWDDLIGDAVQFGAFPVRKENSARRTIREITNRLRQLSDDEIVFFCEAERADQLAFLWLAACRAYRFIREFSVQILSDRFLTGRYEITYGDFDAFYERKAEWAPELAKITTSTRLKLRAVLFRMMREAEILSEDNRIQSALLSSRFVRYVVTCNKDEISIFPGGERLAKGVLP